MSSLSFARLDSAKGAFRLGLMMVLVGLLVAGTGCSWCRHKPPVAAQPTGIETPVTPSTGAGTTAAPTDNSDQPRPGDVRPFPELHTIYFDYNKDNIRADQMPVAEGNLKYLLEHPNDKVLIVGNCDERGTEEYNLNLGQRRAQAIKGYYTSNGVAADRIAVQSKGKDQPVDPGHNEAAWAKNRRCEFMRMY